jgi:hypothetical protein
MKNVKYGKGGFSGKRLFAGSKGTSLLRSVLFYGTVFVCLISVIGLSFAFFGFDTGSAAGLQGEQGPTGNDGEDGLTPHIGENGNWWIGGTDMGVLARGVNGTDGQNGIDGENGADGLTPYIGGNGNWWIGGTDTYVFAGNAGYSLSMISYNGDVGYPGLFDLPVSDFEVGDGALCADAFVISADNFLGQVTGISGGVVTVLFVYHLDLEGPTEYRFTEGEDYVIDYFGDSGLADSLDGYTVFVFFNYPDYGFTPLSYDFFAGRELSCSGIFSLLIDGVGAYSLSFSFDFVPWEVSGEYYNGLIFMFDNLDFIYYVNDRLLFFDTVVYFGFDLDTDIARLSFEVKVYDASGTAYGVDVSLSFIDIRRL